MNPFEASSKIVVTCNKRLAPFLEEEVTELGFKPQRTFSTGLELNGTMLDCIRLNLNLRCASQVLYSVKAFPADRPDAVYQQLVALPWETLIASDGYLSVTSTVDHFTVNNNLFVNVKVKDAIADRIRRHAGERPDSGPELDGTVIHLFWREEMAEVFIDTSGHTLAKHGYRKIPGKAPMLEALATATVMATKWDRKSPFINPMCGSGTIAIEALMIATNRRPGLYRSNYGFMHVTGFDPTMYEVERKRLEEQVVEIPGLMIVATDNRQDAIDISRINAGAADVDHLIQLSVCDFTETPVPETPGVVYLNPEYGERMGELEELQVTYANIGDFLKKKCQGYLGYIFTGNLDLAKKIGLRASRRIEFFNAKLDCRLLEYELYAGSRRQPKPDKVSSAE
ncbi:MAG: class I SAM-dependent RNA methyltransferase [Cyclobacteriaceae bacterium]|nr:class I SAM-dependent RNA methyltransferase [Cyclobacteriaceae bacterium]